MPTVMCYDVMAAIEISIYRRLILMRGVFRCPTGVNEVAGAESIVVLLSGLIVN